MATEEYETILHDLADYGSGTFLGLWVVLPSLLGLGIRVVIPERSLDASMPYVKIINALVLLVLTTQMHRSRSHKPW
jgi:bile acid:Na+ symporter, BASS family